MAHKFINTNLDDEKEENSNSEYSDKIRITPSKAQDEYIDRNSPAARIFLIALGSFCILGVLYYVISWLSTKG